MKRRVMWLAMALAVCLGCLFGVGAGASEAVPRAVLDATGSVVRVYAEYRSDWYSTGTGFVVYSDSRTTLVATNNHVVEGAPSYIEVWLSAEKAVPAKILARSTQKDLAVLELDFAVPLAALPLQAEEAMQGDAIYAVGFPGAADSLSDTLAYSSAEATITDGIISALRQASMTGAGNPVQLLQISAAINPGNSGGPLFNERGEVIGINTLQITDSQGIYGAVAVSELLELLAAHGITPTVPAPEAVPQKNTALLWAALGAGLAVCAGVTAALLLRRRRPRPQKPAALPPMSLRTLVERCGPLTEEQAASLLMPIAIRLRDMHDSGRVHLEIAPERITVADGAASLAERSAQGSARYASGYAAPEIYYEKNCGVPADTYSLCAVLQYALTGADPQNSLARADALAQGGQVSPACPLLQAAADGMRPEPELRYTDVRALIRLLAPYNTGAAIQMTPAAVLPADTAAAPAPQPAAAAPALPLTPASQAPTPPPMAPERIPAPILTAAQAGPTPQRSAVSHYELPASPAPKRGRRWWLLAPALLLCGIAAAGLWYWNSYQQVVELATAGDYAAAGQLPTLPQLTELHDSELDGYIAAGLALNAYRYTEAAEAFDALGDYRDAATLALEARYRKAGQLAGDGEFAAAIDLYSALALRDYRDSAEMILDTRHRHALSLFYQPNMLDSCFSKLRELEKEGYRPAEDSLEELTSIAYTAGQFAYQAGEYRKAKDYFETVGSYQHARDYLLLCRIHLYPNSNYTAQDSNRLQRAFDLEDAADLLLWSNELAHYFLLGRWETADGRHYFQITETEDGRRSNYTLPRVPGDTYTFEQGTYLLSKNNSDVDTPCFFIYARSPDCIDIYCYADGSTYTLYRQ